MRRLTALTEIWCVDFEYHAPGGEPPRPICVCGVEFWSRRQLRLWLWDGAPAEPPFDITSTTALCAYAAQAEASCFFELGWQLPPYVIDAFAEFRVHTNGLRLPGTNGLLDAIEHYGIPHPTNQERKDQMRDLCIKGGPFSEEQAKEIMDYCMEDAVGLANLLAALEADVKRGSNARP
ncbi:MAG: hypothetical protein BGO98_29660 [Myxococcales bacterium 68-20]|nr:hypothetical protein [Myxococcales bacterium]OJY30927.1 MAG: hypothetical protein BGO98_29660 [Myxococcales bacterium 68-20]